MSGYNVSMAMLNSRGWWPTRGLFNCLASRWCLYIPMLVEPVLGKASSTSILSLSRNQGSPLVPGANKTGEGGGSRPAWTSRPPLFVVRHRWAEQASSLPLVLSPSMTAPISRLSSPSRMWHGPGEWWGVGGTSRTVARLHLALPERVTRQGALTPHCRPRRKGERLRGKQLLGWTGDWGPKKRPDGLSVLLVT